METYEDHKTDSGIMMHRQFCNTCGSALWSLPGTAPGFAFTKVGLFERSESVVPTGQCYTKSAVPYLLL